jgi:hypothetical protein
MRHPSLSKVKKTKNIGLFKAQMLLNQQSELFL